MEIIQQHEQSTRQSESKRSVTHCSDNYKMEYSTELWCLAVLHHSPMFVLKTLDADGLFRRTMFMMKGVSVRSRFQNYHKSWPSEDFLKWSRVSKLPIRYSSVAQAGSQLKNMFDVFYLKQTNCASVKVVRILLQLK